MTDEFSARCPSMPVAWDVVPTRRQREVLERLRAGERLVLDNRSIRFEQGGRAVRAELVEALLYRHWIHPPGYPLFAPPHFGTITERGLLALQI